MSSGAFVDVSIVVPALNEGAHVKDVLGHLQSAYPGAELILVDNGSSDDTLAQAESVQGVVTCVENRRGKGYAMQTGVQTATRSLILFHDADLEYRVSDGHVLLDVVRTDPEAMAVGVRAATFGHTPWSSLLANATIRRSLAVRFGRARLEGADILCGTRVLTRRAFVEMCVTAPDFRVETQLTRKALARGMHLVNCPVTYVPRSRTEGKKIRPRHLFGLLREALFERS